MAYAVTGLPLDDFRPLFALSDEALAARGVIRKTADYSPGYPCRITLQDAQPGESVLLLNHESHSAPTPYRSAYAIFVREAADATLRVEGGLPPVLQGRPIALRVFNDQGMLVGADLSRDEALDAAIRKTFENPAAAYIHAHNAAHGCFVARIDRV